MKNPGTVVSHAAIADVFSTPSLLIAPSDTRSKFILQVRYPRFFMLLHLR